MSASLVGSEMCIRDRHATQRELRTGTPWVGKQHAELRRPATNNPWPCNSCLLYTSDAADDM
eukprot:4282672-Alexandrium_andersonii.AAC.1